MDKRTTFSDIERASRKRIVDCGAHLCFGFVV